MKQDRTQDKDQHKRQAHKGVSITQLEFGHRCQPAEQRAETGSHCAQDPGVQDQMGQKRYLFRKVSWQRAHFDNLPLNDQLSINGKQDTAENINKAGDGFCLIQTVCLFRNSLSSCSLSRSHLPPGVSLVLYDIAAHPRGRNTRQDSSPRACTNPATAACAELAQPLRMRPEHARSLSAALCTTS